MSDTVKREKIFKSWTGISEVALIKEVATKGEQIDLCIEYWARKRKLPISEYKLFFQDVVQTYVQRLLTERLVCKAEMVLVNVKRDVKTFYYQFACECKDEELRELVLDHLQKKDAPNYEKDILQLQFHWDLLQQLHNSPELFAKCKTQLRRVNIETLVHCDESYMNRLLAELYFLNRNPLLLKHINKHNMWNYLVENVEMQSLVRWCTLVSGQQLQSEYNELELLFCSWIIEPEMYEYALKTLKTPSETLRNSFAAAGYFFADERDDVAMVLRRICTTESLERNRKLLEKLPLGNFLLNRGLHMLILRDFVKTRELEELYGKFADDEELLKFLVTLKENKLEELKGFEEVSQATKVFLEHQGVDFNSAQPLVTLLEFLSNEPNISTLNCYLHTTALQNIPYLKTLAIRNPLHSSDSNLSSGADNCNNGHEKSMPTPYDFLRKFKHIDLKLIAKDLPPESIASFSNEKLCSKYARKYKLSFLHYLKQQRSCYAIYYLVMNHLQQYGQLTKGHLFSACEAVTEMALQYANDTELVAHCVAFIEMLGYDSQYLRNYLKLCRMLEEANNEYRSKEVTHASTKSYAELSTRVENFLLQRIEEKSATFPLPNYQALIRIVNGSGQRGHWPMQILQHYARDDDWWRLLVLLQYFDVPLAQLQILLNHFKTRLMGEHMLRAFLCELPAQTKRHASFSRQHKKPPLRKTDTNPMSTSVETITSSISSANCNDPNNALFRTAPSQQRLHFLPDACGRLDVFAIVLLSSSPWSSEERISSANKFLELMQDQHRHATSWNLLKNCVKYRLPILAVLAATANPANVDWQWLVWLAVATNQWSIVLKLTTLDLRKVTWLLVETTVRQSDVTLLLRSFHIFFEGNACTYLCHFLQRTQQKRLFDDEDVHSLRLFLLAWSNDSVEMPFCNSLARNELMQHSIRLLLIHLQYNFDSTLEQQKFISCLCRSDMSDISGVVNFCLLYDVFEALQTRPGWTQCYTIDFEQLVHNDKQIYEKLLDALRENREFDVAVRLATLLQQPISDIVYSKWVSKLEETELAVDEEGPYSAATFQLYEDEIAQHSLPPELLVNFYLYAAGRLLDSCARKYQLLKRALTVIKQHHLFPNESFDRDQIEYEMIICYLQLDDDLASEMGIYHSQYYEQIMLNERCVLYKSFLELKELAGIEDLDVSLKQTFTRQMEARLEALLNFLLDKGDIVEALRLQELFECRPIDLRFVVFCMALAEGVTTIFSMSSEERQMLRDIEISSFAKFNKRTLDSGLLARDGQHSPTKLSSDLSDSCSTCEFEEIPSKEKRETLETIQGIASKLSYGVNIGRRIVMAYRAAMYLDKEYLDVLRTKDSTVLLQSVAEEGCLHRLLVVSDILTSTHMTQQEIAELLALELTTAILRPRFYIFTADHQSKNAIKNAQVWGYNIDRDLHLFLELVPNTTKLGNCLLEYCDALKEYRKYQDNKPLEHNTVFERLAEIIRRYGLPTNNANQMSSSIPPITTASNSGSMLPPAQVLSHKKQNIIYVELLIKAHQCYVHECSMEGIANVLNRAKALNSVLTQAKSWSLIVRMLSGIGRFREMFYCFDSLLKNDQFESLLGQIDEEKTIGLRQAIITYLREYCPNNGREYLKLTALHFLMYQELAEMWEQDAQAVLANIFNLSAVGSTQLTEQLSMANLTSPNSTKTFIPKLRCTPELITLLQQAMEYYTHATENYLLDNKLLLAQRVASLAEMVAMQIDLTSKALDRNAVDPHLCVCVVNVQTREEFRELINAELSVPQSLLLSRAYGYDINWSEVLLSQYIILEHTNYLQEYLQHLQITDNIIDNTVKGFQLYAQHHRITPQMEEHLAQLVRLVKSVTLKYKLASLLSLKPIIMSLINEHTAYYLRDTNFGRNDNHNLPDM